MSLAAGSKLGPCEIQSQLGAGRMGEVYRANDKRLDRNVAVTVLPTSRRSVAMPDPGTSWPSRVSLTSPTD